MITGRLGIRIDPEHRHKLDELAKKERRSVTEVILEMIDRVYEEDIMRARRIEAARRLGEMEVEDVPDPEELSRQLAKTYDIPDLY